MSNDTFNEWKIMIRIKSAWLTKNTSKTSKGAQHDETNMDFLRPRTRISYS